ncbi:unnamed protein product [Moneuplotes crassus]|uniref:IPT/TIG domain-containing protein n=2 Tax=Euplotes crassus TaxID=5936 RepID=A0AAD2D8E5_EUPCR|nr:unnamed protein product [Moneuplotes crassus]
MRLLIVLALVLALVVADNTHKIELLGIEPNSGPLSGNTRVLVRATDLGLVESKYPDPKCKFGRNDKVVEASFVRCTPEPLKVWEMEPPVSARTDTCLQCENAPPGFKAEIVPFTISLTGDFSDVINSVGYRYYKDPKVYSIYPRYGIKDGGTKVDVWGENFLNFEDFTRCGFGSVTVPAVYIDSNHMQCTSPSSDLVEKGIPFVVTLNGQQNTKDRIDYWYYSQPSIQSISPTRGPDDGGNEIIVNGNNFDPFRLYEINNHNDTFCKFDGLKLMPATVHESTKISCTAPPSFERRQSKVEVTLNNQQFTNNGEIYSYYKPPYVFDIEPRQGPTEGGTNITLFGSNFKEGVPFKCKFGDHISQGQYISSNKVSCISPPNGRSEFIPLSVAFDQDEWSSGQTKFLYYKEPTLSRIEPTCGPEAGYTQLTVYGQNFINLGIGNAHCVFNRTIHTNATVMEHDIIKCDTPSAPEIPKGAPREPQFYYVEVTLDGTLNGGPPQRFNYYREPEIQSIDPILGPLQGGTQMKIKGHGFDRNACNMTVRFGNTYARPTSITPNEITVKSPPVRGSHAAVVGVGPNGQQFTQSKSQGKDNSEHAFHYYDNPIIYDFDPEEGLSNGGTEVKIRGHGFQPTKYENGTYIDSPVYVRMLDAKSGRPLGPSTKADFVENDLIRWKAPPAPPGTEGIISLSLNDHQFYELYQKNKGFSFKYMSSPFVTHINPEFGEIRRSNDMTIDVHGNSFDCPNNNCNDVTCKFGTDPNSIVIKGYRQSSNLIKCPIPDYPQPDVLDVEVSMNGKDYSNNKVHFGFYDPFVLRVEPRLVSKSGTTKVEISGFGFVDSTNAGGLKVLYDNDRGSYYCNKNRNKCVVDAGFVDKNKIVASTLPFNMFIDGNGNRVRDTDPVNVEVSVFNDKFTNNKIKIHYYEDPEFKDVIPDTAPAGTQTPLMIETDFKLNQNNEEIFMENADFECRFRSLNLKEERKTHGHPIAYPYKSGAPPNNIQCSTPVWPLGGRTYEDVKVDITANGVDYFGNFDFTFTDENDNFNRYSRGGPAIHLLGRGFDPKKDTIGKLNVNTQEILEQRRSQGFLGNNLMKSKDLSSATEILTQTFEKNSDKKRVYETLSMNSQKISHPQNNYEGSVYWELDSKEDVFSNMPPELAKYTNTISFAESFFYKQPEVKNIHPHGGPIEGGTEIVVEGADFQYNPDKGVIPHCQIGDKIVKARYESSVRIICPAPPGDSIDKKYPIKVALNNEDFMDTGKFFHYYKNSKIKSINPTSGPSSGGTTIKMEGEQFSDLSDPNEFVCKFTPLNKDVPPKTVSAKYLDQSTVLCPSPGGFGNVDVVNLDVSFNGVDYTNSNQQFRYYKIITADPRSGPSEGSNDNIKIRGQGFKDDGKIKCKLDNQEYQPSKISWDEIHCPMLPSQHGKDYFGNVPFAVNVNGEDYHSFSGGFQYFKQPTVSSIYPTQGPNVGHGKIHFYGDNFRDDFPLSEAYCKVGESYGKATVLDSKNMECKLDELSLSEDSKPLPAQISLNNASWTPVNKYTYYTPYGIKSLTPNSGPIAGGTDITVSGSGFKGASNPKCRFGVPGSYAKTSGKVISDTKMVCQSPGGYEVPKQASLPFSVPFSVAMNGEEYEPWTTSAHRFRFYDDPTITSCTPNESEVGQINEVFLYSDKEQEFIQPIPVAGSKYSDYGIHCKFGKYGETPGIIVDANTVKCNTPNIHKKPEDLDREVVTVSVAQNGQNYNEYNSECDYVFTGTGSGTSFWPWIIGLLLLFILLIAALLCCATIIGRRKRHYGRKTAGLERDRDAPHIVNKRPRGVPSGPMEYDFFSNNESLNRDHRSQYGSTSNYGTRTNRGY